MLLNKFNYRIESSTSSYSNFLKKAKMRPTFFMKCYNLQLFIPFHSWSIMLIQTINFYEELKCFHPSQIHSTIGYTFQVCSLCDVQYSLITGWIFKDNISTNVLIKFQTHTSNVKHFYFACQKFIVSCFFCSVKCLSYLIYGIYNSIEVWIYCLFGVGWGNSTATSRDCKCCCCGNPRCSPDRDGSSMYPTKRKLAMVRAVVCFKWRVSPI